MLAADNVVPVNGAVTEKPVGMHAASPAPGTPSGFQFAGVFQVPPLAGPSQVFVQSTSAAPASIDFEGFATTPSTVRAGAPETKISVPSTTLRSASRRAARFMRGRAGTPARW